MRWLIIVFDESRVHCWCSVRCLMVGHGCHGAKQWMGLRWVCLVQVHTPEAGPGWFTVPTQYKGAGPVVDVERVFVDVCAAVGIAEFAETE